MSSQMKYCQNCGAQIPANSAFCTACGARQGTVQQIPPPPPPPSQYGAPPQPQYGAPPPAYYQQPPQR